MERKKLSAEEIESSLSALNDWKIDGVNLKKRFEFENFAGSLEFVNKVSAVAEKRDHHPDINFGWGYAEFSITTHDVGSLTHNDFELAREIESL